MQKYATHDLFKRIEPEDAMVGERPCMPDPLKSCYDMGYGHARAAKAMRLCGGVFEVALNCAD